ncbi:transketolase [Patescibacteria group bacterium]|nr:transketolase [Patescibacteria group bacterium]
MTVAKIKAVAREIRKHVIEMAYNAGGAHIGCSLSVVDVLACLYFNTLNIKPKLPHWKERDYFILSKGHACSALYATLAERGFFSPALLKRYMKNGSPIAGHVTLDSLPGIEATTGSLGHGLSLGTGIALSLKNDNKNSKVYVLVGDGEMEEGSVWEAVMFGGHNKINRLILIIDNNDLQIIGKSTAIMHSHPFEEKLESFGWKTVSINGHNINEIIDACKQTGREKPLAIIAKTIKGKGISFMENKLEWHGKSLTRDDYEKAIGELNKIP